MSADAWFEIASSVCLLIGALLSLAAGIGLLRFPDALSRMHAATKPQIAGLAFILLAIALEQRNWATVSTLFLVMLFQMLTAPVAAHMIGRAAYRTRHLRRELLLTDELADVVDRASQDLATDPAARPD